MSNNHCIFSMIVIHKREPGKVAKVIVKATEEEIKKLITQINKEVQIIIQE